jgi:hypothetical protein
MDMKTSMIASIALLTLAGSTTCYAGPVNHDYLEPCADVNYCADPAFLDAVGKISVDCDKMTFVFRAHGLQAGRVYQLNSGGGPIDLDSNEEAVGNGIAGLGNNVLMKGDLFLGEPGTRWNLYDVTDGDPTELNNRILIGDVSACE